MAAAIEEAGVDAPPGDVNTEEGSADALKDVATTDANAYDEKLCTPDSSTAICCCEGDIGATLVCTADGKMACSNTAFPQIQFGIYYRADCTRECGPCSVACPFDAGTKGSEAGSEGGSAGAEAGIEAGIDAAAH